MRLDFAIDPAQELAKADELRLVAHAAELGYGRAWTPGTGDASAFDRCIEWFAASGLPTGIAVVPASAQSPEFYAEHAARVWEATRGQFILGLGSGRMAHPSRSMPSYVARVRSLLPSGLPVYLAALGPLMLRTAAAEADGVCLNWCTRDQAQQSRQVVQAAAARHGRRAPVVVEYVRTAVAGSAAAALRAAQSALLGYAIGPPQYEAHFARMGLGPGLGSADRGGESLLARVTAFGAPGQVRRQFLDLAEPLDVAIVRVLVSPPDAPLAARLTLEECRPGPAA